MGGFASFLFLLWMGILIRNVLFTVSWLYICTFRFGKMFILCPIGLFKDNTRYLK